MFATITLEMSVWALICLVFTITIVARSGRIVWPVILGAILYSGGLLIGLLFKGAFKLLICPFKLVYNYPLHSMTVLGFIAVIYAIYRLTSRKKKKNEEQQPTKDSGESTDSKTNKTKIIDAKFED